jgi:hypothetical protein
MDNSMATKPYSVLKGDPYRAYEELPVEVRRALQEALVDWCPLRTRMASSPAAPAAPAAGASGVLSCRSHPQTRSRRSSRLRENMANRRRGLSPPCCRRDTPALSWGGRHPHRQAHSHHADKNARQGTGEAQDKPTPTLRPCISDPVILCLLGTAVWLVAQPSAETSPKLTYGLCSSSSAR